MIPDEINANKRLSDDSDGESSISNTTLYNESDGEGSSSSTGNSLSCVSDALSNLEIETPAPYGVVDIQEVATAEKKGKRYFCKFCCKLVTKIARHLETVHKSENEVKSFALLPKG